ncbi:MAG: tetratricopeptide repeat protein [Nitrospira sp.]
MNPAYRARIQLSFVLLVSIGLWPIALHDTDLLYAGPIQDPAGQASGQPDPSEGAEHVLPDDGPRMEGQSQGMDALALQEGINAYGKQAWEQARRFFTKVVSQQPESSLTPTALAFLAETALHEDTSNANRIQAFDRYKTLLRDYPNSLNAKRAEWRLGDLYLQQGWHQEAQSLYERALSHNPNSMEGERALLGIGYTALSMKKWRDAEHTFDDLRKHSTHEQILMHATVGLATTLYRQRRFPDALALYDLAYRRWPRSVRLDPVALKRYATIHMDLHHDVIGRDLLLQFYNLYPSHPDAAGVLLRLADSLLNSQKLASAELFYAYVSAHFAPTPQAALAGVRLATLRVHQQGGEAKEAVSSGVALLMYSPSDSDKPTDEYMKRMRMIAAEHEGDAIGSEALFHLAEYLERKEAVTNALLVYREIVDRTSASTDNPWLARAADRLATILRPWMEAAVRAHDDVTLIALFHRHGPGAERQYLSSPLLLEIAEAHERLGFATEAVRLYQLLTKSHKPGLVTEQALIGLARTYLAQQDPQAARKVLERYRLEHPIGRQEREALHLIVQAMTDEPDLAGLLHFSRSWMIHHPKHPERPWMYQQMAMVFTRMNKLDEALLATEEGFKAGAPKTADSLLIYADLLTQANRHERAIEVYQTVADKSATASQREWARLQIVRGWQALKQFDRATVALAELGQTGDPLVTRFSSTYRENLQHARQVPQEGL